MPLIQTARALAGSILFFREGDNFTLPAPGTASVSAKPGADDTGWIDFGPIQDGELDVSGGNEHEVWRPSPGRLVLADVIVTKEKATLKFTAGEISPLAIESLFRSNQKLNSLAGQFNPLSGDLRKGWLHAQLYDHENNLFLTLDHWVRLKCTGGIKLNGEVAQPTFEALFLFSTLNTAAIGEA
ncbi:MAG: hypothetical protein N3I86_06600 [Verrucomicrobiae bacterium]|nr:hypothetical protein [Verrucomicrobiae bacterium]MDW8308850.1 hypothetical protein [Verrucomicrobiales bacterium]